MNDGPDNPVPRFRTVYLTAFFTANGVGLVYLAITEHLWEAVTLDPVALFGAFLGVGLAGMIAGSVCGLFSRLLLGETRPNEAWRAAVGVAFAVSAAVGFLITYGLVAMLWNP